MAGPNIVITFLEKLWGYIKSWRKSTIRSTDSGIFDPYLPIGSLKPLSEDYVASTDNLVDFDPAAPDQPEVKRGFNLFRLVVILLAGGLAVRLIILQISQGQANYLLAEGNRLKTQLVTAPRGLIYDRNGAALVSNTPSFSVVLDLADVPRKASEAQTYTAHLAQALGLDPAALAQQIKDNQKKQQITLLEGINRDQALSLELKLNNTTGAYLITSPVRQYSTTVADLGHLLGYIGKVTADDLKTRPDLLSTSYIGKSGLESQYDQILQGKPGIDTFEVDSKGRTVRQVGSQPPQPGDSLILGLDSGVQNVTESALQDAISKNHATSGAAVAMDVRTGDILAMASAPTFDNNLFSPSTSSAARQAILSDPLSPLLNRAIAGQYPSGSTVKPTVAAAALQEGVITANTKIDTSQPITVGAQTFHDWTKHGLANVIDYIKTSNDIFSYTIGGGHGSIGGLGVDRLDAYLEKFGFGQKTGIDLPGEKAGNVPTPAWKQKVQHDRWFLGDTYNLSIGQGGFLITPLQLTDDIAAIANGGTLYQPKMVKSVVGPNGQPQDVASQVRQTNLVDAANIQTVREGMHQAVQPGGTAHFILGSLPIDTAAKTGTAQTSSSLTNTHAWFTAFAPFNNPEIAVSVVIEGGGEGFDVAGPVARQVIEQYFHLPLSPINPALPGQ